MADSVHQRHPLEILPRSGTGHSLAICSTSRFLALTLSASALIPYLASPNRVPLGLCCFVA